MDQGDTVLSSCQQFASCVSMASDGQSQCTIPGEGIQAVQLLGSAGSDTRALIGT